MSVANITRCDGGCGKETSRAKEEGWIQISAACTGNHHRDNLNWQAQAMFGGPCLRVGSRQEPGPVDLCSDACLVKWARR
jgi:hypothetical protein